MSLFKVTLADGNTAEVDASAIEAPENFLIANTETGIPGFVKQEVMTETLKERTSKAKENALKDAYKDEAVRNQVVSELGIQLDEDGKPKGLKSSDVDLEKERSKWEDSRYKPLESELKEEKSFSGELTSSMVETSILSAFAGIAKDEYLSRELGNKPFVVATIAPKFKYNREIRKVVQVDEQGNFEHHPAGSSGSKHGFIEPEHFIQIHSDSKLLKSILKDDSQGSSGLQPGGNPGKNTMKRNDFDKLPDAQKSKFFSEGGTVVD